MLRLGLFKGKPGRTVQGVKLEDEEYQDYNATVGQARWTVLTPYVRSPQFQALAAQNPELARYNLERLWDRIGADMRVRWLYQNPQVLERARDKRARPRAIGSQFLEP